MNDHGRDNQPREPFVVRRDYDPGGMFAGCMADHIFIVPMVVLPEAALPDVGGRKLPVLFRLIETRKKAALLLLLAHIQKELANRDSIPGGVAFKGGNVFEALLPYFSADASRRQTLRFQQLRVYSHHQDFFVVGD